MEIIEKGVYCRTVYAKKNQNKKTRTIRIKMGEYKIAKKSREQNMH